MGRTPTRFRLWTPAAGGITALGFSIAQAIQPAGPEDQLEADWTGLPLHSLGRPAAWPPSPVAHFQPQFHGRVASWEQTGSAPGACPKQDRNRGPARGQTPSTIRPRYPDRRPGLTWAIPADTDLPPEAQNHARTVSCTRLNGQSWADPGLDLTPEGGAAPKASTGQTADAA